MSSKVHSLIRSIVSTWWCWPLLAALVLGAGTTVLYISKNVRLNRDTTIPEGAVVYSIRAVGSSTSLYRNYSEPPYATTPYPPLYYVVSAMVTRWFDGDTADVEHYYLGGRCVTVVATIAASIFAAFGARRSGCTIVGMMVAIASTLSLSFLAAWSSTCRPDMLALALALFGLFQIKRAKTSADVMAGIAFSASVLAKHSFIAAPMAAILWLLMNGHLKRVALIGVTLAVNLGLALLACHLMWSTYFWKNILIANIAPISWSQPFGLLKHFIGASFVPCCMAAATILDRWRRGLRISSAYSLDYLYTLSSLLVAIASARKLGADINYFLEPGFAVAILSAHGWSSLVRVAQKGFTYRVLMCPLLIVICYQTYRIAWTAYKQQTFENFETEEYRNNLILGAIKQISGPVLVGDAGVAVRCGKQELLLDKFNASYLSDRGEVDFTTLLNMLQNKEIKAIFTSVPFGERLQGQLWWPRPILDIIHKNYEFDKAIIGCVVYVPKKDI